MVGWGPARDFVRSFVAPACQRATGNKWRAGGRAGGRASERAKMDGDLTFCRADQQAFRRRQGWGEGRKRETFFAAKHGLTSRRRDHGCARLEFAVVGRWLSCRMVLNFHPQPYVRSAWSVAFIFCRDPDDKVAGTPFKERRKPSRCRRTSEEKREREEGAFRGPCDRIIVIWLTTPASNVSRPFYPHDLSRQCTLTAEYHLSYNTWTSTY